MVKEIATECKCEALSTKLIPPKTKKKKRKKKKNSGSVTDFLTYCNNYHIYLINGYF
jgi:hypothetical protein